MLATGTTLGPYQILAPLGAGGMGEVYRAHDSRLGRDVAIKVLSPHLAAAPEVRARFEREARTISQLNHPHICTLHDIGHQDGTDYLVMELLEGETLAHRLEKGPLPVAEVLSLGTQIADALDRAHRAGVVHRDLKPGNVMLTKSGAKLMDFGLARAASLAAAPGTLTESPTVSRPLTAEGTIVGTFQYMAPEQLEGKEADARTDLWALGCVLYEMATGRRAFEGTSQASLISAIMDREPRPITDLQPLTPPALEGTVHQCFAKDPDKRWQSAQDVALALELVRAASGVQAPGAAPARPRARYPIGVWVAGALSSALLVAIALLLAGRLRPTTDPSHVTYTRLTVQRGTIENARFSPDGKTVFYSAAWDGRPPEVFETRPGFPTSRALGLAQTSLASISGSGMMAVTLGSTLGMLGLGPTSGMLAQVPISGGAPRQILADVLAADWAPDGTTLAVAHRVGGKARLEMPPGHVLYETSREIRNIRVSRDGRLVAFTNHPLSSDYRSSVVILDTSGRLITRTAEWYAVDGLAWSADGRELWFCAARDNAAEDLRAVVPGGRERVVARVAGTMQLLDIARNGQVLLKTNHFQVGIRGRGSPSEDERELGWFDWSMVTDISSEGRELLFEEEGVFGGPYYAVCLRGMDGSPPVELGEGRAAALSPDGRWALAIHFGPPQRLLLYPTGAGDSVSLTRGPIETYYGARWLPDGKSVIFAAAEAGHARRTYVQDLAGGPPRAITPEGIAGTLVSPDGRVVAAVSPEQKLFVCAIGGGEARLAAQLLPNETPVQWTSDGRSLYVGRPGTSMLVDLMNLDSGRRVPWKRFSVPDSAGVRVRGLVMIPDGRSYAYGYFRWLDHLYLAEGLK
jgi:serine/threonine protein kinase